jgi:phosphoserine phosphatase
VDKPILFVDLDDCLIKTDIVREQLIQSFIARPWMTLKMLFRQRFRPERIKTILADQIIIDPETLPYRADVLDLIHQAKAAGRVVVLATATHEVMAQKIAKHLGLFEAVLATTQTYNCKGAKKLAKMKEFAAGRSFDYIGDSRADLAIFPHTQTAYIIGHLSYAGPHQRLVQPRIWFPVLKALWNRITQKGKKR